MTSNLKTVWQGSALALCIALGGGTAQAALIGTTDGPDSSYAVNFNFEHTTDAPTADIVSLSLDGSTATGFPVLWDSIGLIGGTADLPSISGLDTQVVTFTWAPGGFSVGDTFVAASVDPDGDPGPVRVKVGQLAGVTVSALYADGAQYSGEFVDDDSRYRKGLKLLGTYLDGADLDQVSVSEVPLPAAAPMFVAAIAGLGFAGWRKRKAA